MAKVKSSGAVIFRLENKKPIFLLLHYVSGHWEFVKGHIEKGEDEITTAKREAKEETGLSDLNFIKDFKEKIHYFYKRGKETVSKEVVFYLAETSTKKIELSHEHQGFDWLEYEKAIERLTFDNAKNTLKKAYEKIKEEGICK